jgi:DNA-binding winged helix-turn-helix (wHTH) protein/Tol biopolymer transport system component
VRFGVFELDSSNGELRKRGVKVKLQGKPLQVLRALLEKPGQVITREELQQRLWASDVFVDFESGLNTAANRLRIALGDSADNPRYIETLARTGYRFIAPVEVVKSSLGSIDKRRHGRRLVASVAMAATAVLLVLGTFRALRPAESGSLQFQQITFGRGQVWGARFAPDGQTIVYTASWDNGRRQLFLKNPFSTEARSLGFDELRLVSVSRSGELALMSFDGTVPITGGTLSRVSMNGGSPMPVEHDIMSADWSADGHDLAIVRALTGANQLEFPIGRPLHKTSGWISSIRISPDGNSIAFVEHPVRHDTQGSVKLAELGRSVRALTGLWANVGGVAWHPSGREIWFTASRDGDPKSLWAVSTSGKVRSLAQIAGSMTLRDISKDGRALVSRETQRLEMAAVIAGETKQRDLSWHDWSRVADVSADGGTILFDESGIAAGPQYVVYIHRLDDQSTVRIGEGRAMALSPDGKFALALGTQERTRFRLLPIGEGTAVELRPTGLEYQWARFFPDGKRLLALASEPDQPLRLYVQPLTGKPFPITPPMVVRNVAISPDGTNVALLSPDGRLAIYPVVDQGAPPRIVPTTGALAPLLWTDDNYLYVQELGAYTQIPSRISRLNVATGGIHSWREVAPADPLGVNAITKVMLSQDTRTVIFNYRRVLSELFVASASPR